MLLNAYASPTKDAKFTAEEEYEHIGTIVVKLPQVWEASESRGQYDVWGEWGWNWGRWAASSHKDNRFFLYSVIVFVHFPYEAMQVILLAPW